MAIKLSVVLAGRVLSDYEYEYQNVDQIRIGRSPACDVHIDNVGLSRFHCEIVRRDQFVQVRDLGSANGSFVNGKRIRVHTLNDGDAILIGKYTIRFTCEELVEDAEAPPSTAPEEPELGQLTMNVDQAQMARQMRASATGVRGYLILPDGKELVLSQPVLTFGSDVRADIKLSGWFCPRLVAVLARYESGFMLIDVSPGGKEVTLNNRTVPRLYTRLENDAVIGLRGLEVRFKSGVPVGSERE